MPLDKQQYIMSIQPIGDTVGYAALDQVDALILQMINTTWLRGKTTDHDVNAFTDVSNCNPMSNFTTYNNVSEKDRERMVAYLMWMGVNLHSSDAASNMQLSDQNTSDSPTKRHNWVGYSVGERIF